MAANAQRGPWHMFEMIPNVAVLMFAAAPGGDAAQLVEVVEKSCGEKKKTLPVSVTTYL